MTGSRQHDEPRSPNSAAGRAVPATDRDPRPAPPPASGGYPGAVEVVNWIALAMTSGVLGNAAYDSLKRIWADMGKRGNATVASRDAAIDVARIALRGHHQRLGLVEDDIVRASVSADAQPRRDGRWFVEFSWPTRSIVVELPPGDVVDAEVKVLDSDPLSSGGSMRGGHLPGPRPHAPVKLTVNILARVMGRLEEVCEETGESRTDAVNRAIQLYALYYATIREGGTFLIRSSDGRERELHVL